MRFIPTVLNIAAASLALAAGCQQPAQVPAGQAVSAMETPHVEIELTEDALRIHRAGLLIDGHNDLPGKFRQLGDSSFEELDLTQPQEKLYTDIPRLRRGGVGAQFWAAYVPNEKMQTGGAARHCLEEIDLIHRMVQRYPADFALALTAADVERIHRAGKIACLIGVEGGHAIESSLGVLRTYYALGARYMTLTHNETNDWADSATDEARHSGLSEFGEQVVREMNRLGMLVDISHVSAEAMHDVLRVSRAPVIASHSSAYAIAPYPRNVPDDVLRLIKDNGGVVMINFFSGFIDPEAARVTQVLRAKWRELKEQYPNEEDREQAKKKLGEEHPIPRGTVSTLVDHIDHIVRVAGIDHVGLGSDFDGITLAPAPLEDVSSYPYITQELVNREYTEEQIHRIMGGNLLRAMRRAEEVARNGEE